MKKNINVDSVRKWVSSCALIVEDVPSERLGINALSPRSRPRLTTTLPTASFIHHNDIRTLLVAIDSSNRRHQKYLIIHSHFHNASQESRRCCDKEDRRSAESTCALLW